MGLLGLFGLRAIRRHNEHGLREQSDSSAGERQSTGIYSRNVEMYTAPHKGAAEPPSASPRRLRAKSDQCVGGEALYFLVKPCTVQTPIMAA